MDINRRTFLAMGAGLLPLVVPGLAWAQDNALFASASESQDGRQHFVHLFDQQGREVLRHTLPDRAHQVLKHPTQPWLMVAGRRPSTFLDVVDYQQNKLVKRITCEPNRHMCGHLQVTPDGRYLLTTENAIDTSQGCVVYRDIHQQFSVVREVSTGGLGTHELIMMPDQKTLVIANGGIRTRGRDKVNLDTMKPSLSYMDLALGTLQEQVMLSDEYHQSSIRHIDVSASGQVVIAMQYQGGLTDPVPLVALHQRGEAITPLEMPEAVRLQLKQYCGSACFDGSGNIAAVSAPRGNQVLFWDTASRALLSTMRMKDGCGLASLPGTGQFLVSTGRGRLYTVDVANRKKSAIRFSGLSKVKWDNHLAAAV